MRKRLVLGDLHGIGIWKDIYEKESPNDVIILGDYFDSFNLSPEVQALNFEDLLKCKEAHEESGRGKFVMLLGNHDYHYLTCINERYSGYNEATAKYASSKVAELIDANRLPIVLVDAVNKIVFSHAGVSQKWFDEHVGTELEAINTASLQSFKFTYRDSGDWYGSSVYSSPLWIRPEGLIKFPYTDKSGNCWNQIYGHTHIAHPTKTQSKEAYFIDLDTLNNGYYMVQLLDDKGKIFDNSIEKFEF